MTGHDATDSLFCAVPDCDNDASVEVRGRNERRGISFVIPLCERHADVVDEAKLRELAALLDEDDD